MSDTQNPFAPPQADLALPQDSAPQSGERSLEDAMAGNWSITPSEVVKKAWELKDGYKGLFIMVAIVLVVPGIISSVLSGALSTGDGFLVDTMIGVGVAVVLLPLTAPLQAGLWRVQIKRATGGSPVIGEMFGHFDKVVQLSIAALVVLVATYIGFALLILPGIYISIAGSLTLPLVAERGLSPVEAFKTSLKAVSSHFFDVLVLYLLVGLMVFAGVIALGIGLIWAMPAAFIATGMLYTTIFGWEEK